MNPGDKMAALLILGAVLIIAIALASVGITALVSDALTRDLDGVPRCEEHQIIVGYGDFSYGHWDEYTCQTID